MGGLLRRPVLVPATCDMDENETLEGTDSFHDMDPMFLVVGGLWDGWGNAEAVAVAGTFVESVIR